MQFIPEGLETDSRTTPRRLNHADARDVLGGMAIRGQVATTNEASLRGLYAAQGGALLADATRVTGERASAEDIVQGTLVRA